MTESGTTALIPTPAARVIPGSSSQTLPALIAEAGTAASFAWDEFFNAIIRNPHTRAAYGRAVSGSCWAEPQGSRSPRLLPAWSAPISINSRAARPRGSCTWQPCVRSLTHWLFAMSSPKPGRLGTRGTLQVIEGKTPEISIVQARTLARVIQDSQSRRSRQQGHAHRRPSRPGHHRGADLHGGPCRSHGPALPQALCIRWQPVDAAFRGERRQVPRNPRAP